MYRPSSGQNFDKFVYLEVERQEPPVDENIGRSALEAWPFLRWRRGRGTRGE